MQTVFRTALIAVVGLTLVLLLSACSKGNTASERIGFFGDRTTAIDLTIGPDWRVPLEVTDSTVVASFVQKLGTAEFIGKMHTPFPTDEDGAIVLMGGPANGLAFRYWKDRELLLDVVNGGQYRFPPGFAAALEELAAAGKVYPRA